MHHNPDRFGERSLLWAVGGGVMTGFGVIALLKGGLLVGLFFLGPVATGAFAVGAVHALIGLSRGETPANCLIGLLANLIGGGASLCLGRFLPLAGGC